LTAAVREIRGLNVKSWALFLAAMLLIAAATATALTIPSEACYKVRGDLFGGHYTSTTTICQPVSAFSNLASDKRIPLRIGIEAAGLVLSFLLGAASAADQVGDVVD
jgi:hypothetical protein